MISRQVLEKEFDAGWPRFLDEWKQFLSFPSISTSPEHKLDCRNCAEWLAAHLRGMAFDPVLIETSTNPLVFAEKKGMAGRPVVLFYGHYDVQPVDPIGEWLTDPFAPEERNGRIYARGAQDNKGQLFYVLKAIEVLRRASLPECGLKILLEGEEEHGSRGISGFLADSGDMVKADILMVTDVEAAPSGAPAIVMGLRGILGLTVELRGPATDLHSGTHGGVAPNPAEQMAKIIASLHNDDGSIAVKDYCRDVLEPSEEELRLLGTLSFDEALYRSQTGVPPAGGEKQFAPAMRAGFRPTIEVNGIHSGYGGAGSKTIIPSRATAKITSRIVSGQDPAECLAMLERHLKAAAPAGLEMLITGAGVGGPPVRVSPGSAAASKAAEILKGLTGRDVVYLYEGASIPIVSKLAEVSRAEPLMAGFGLPGDCIHAPNESFSIMQFRDGFLYAGSVLSAV